MRNHTLTVWNLSELRYFYHTSIYFQLPPLRKVGSYQLRHYSKKNSHILKIFIFTSALLVL